MSNYDQDATQYPRQQWEILCAKHGLPDASNIKGSGLNYATNEAHEARKTMRRAATAITARLHPNEFSNEVTAGLSHAARSCGNQRGSTTSSRAKRTALKPCASVATLRSTTKQTDTARASSAFDFARRGKPSLYWGL